DRCDYLSDKYRCEIYIKKEFFNPSKSAKDRPALHMINTAIENQQLKPRDTIVEASSGNTGIAIAYYARIMGDRKSTRLNSSHVKISYAVFCVKKTTAYS